MASGTMQTASATPVTSNGKLASAHAGMARRRLINAGLFVLLLACVFFSVCLGRYEVTPAETAQVLFAALTGGTGDLNQIKVNVVMQVRLPRILMSVLVGAALAAAGCTYQAIFGNPLVSPDILGVSSGAGFGAALGILISGSALVIQGFSLGFGLIAVALVVMLGRVQRRTQLYMLVLAGVIVTALFNAFTSLVKYVADPYDKLPVITTWLMGSMANSSYSDLAVQAAVTLPCLAILVALRWKLNLLSLDEEEARSLGVDVGRLRMVAIVVATLLTATSVSICGIIGWVGLVMPHVGRMVVGNDHRVLMPASFLLGATYLLLIDDISRSVTGVEIPISILTAIIGAPFFAWLLRRSSRGKQG